MLAAGLALDAGPACRGRRWGWTRPGRRAAALRDHGIGLTLDGFGAGLASLTVLRRLPLTGLKLARSVVRGLPGDGDDVAVARAGIAMAHAMGLVAIADGIETEAQRAFLRDAAARQGQATVRRGALAPGLPGRTHPT